MIQTTIVDDHPAVRAGLAALVAREPGFILAADVGTAAEALGAVQRLSMDLVIADYHLVDGDGIALCRTLKRRHACRHAVLYSAFADERLAVAAAVAGLDGVIHKGVPAPALFDRLREVVRGRGGLPAISPATLAVVSEALPPEHAPIVGMRIDGASEPEVADALRISLADAEQRIEQIVAQLKPRRPSVVPA